MDKTGIARATNIDRLNDRRPNALAGKSEQRQRHRKHGKIREFVE